MSDVSTFTKIDIERLRGVLEFIAADPSKLTVAFWGIKMLEREFPRGDKVYHSPAGWVVALSPWHKILWTRDSKRKDFAYAEFTEVVATGQKRHIRPVARELLGFTREQDNLFSTPSNSLYSLWGYANIWTNGVIQRPDYVTPSGLRH